MFRVVVGFSFAAEMLLFDFPSIWVRTPFWVSLCPPFPRITSGIRLLQQLSLVAPFPALGIGPLGASALDFLLRKAADEIHGFLIAVFASNVSFPPSWIFPGRALEMLKNTCVFFFFHVVWDLKLVYSMLAVEAWRLVDGHLGCLESSKV